MLRAAAGDKYVISAKAGGVNFVEGSVAIVRKDGRSGHLLKRDNISIGDRVSTGMDGKAEILLNPGSFLRLGGNSAFEFKTTDLDDLKIQVDHGSAILEVFAADDFKVTVLTPSSTYYLIQTGVYRVNVPENGSVGQLEVWKGKAMVGSNVVKAGKIVTENGAEVAVAKFDRSDKDPFEAWSKDRSKELAKVTTSLQRNALRPALMQSFLGRRWNVFNSFGLWIFDPFGGGYCFLPFGYGWESPYGYGYGRYLGSYQLPNAVYMPPMNPGMNAGGGGGASSAAPNTRIWTSGDRTPVPPFIRMQGTSGTGRDFGSSSNSASSESPGYIPNSSSSGGSAPATVSMPVREPKAVEPQSKKP